MIQQFLTFIFAVTYVFNVNYLHCQHHHSHNQIGFFEELGPEHHLDTHTKEHSKSHNEDSKSQHKISCLKDSKRSEDDFQIPLDAPVALQFEHIYLISFDPDKVDPFIDQFTLSSINLKTHLIRGPPKFRRI